jgi:hypothetical protein
MSETPLRLICDQMHGPMLLKIDFLSRCEGDFLLYIHREKEPNDARRLWKFRTRTQIVIEPQRAYDPSKPTAKEAKFGSHDMKIWHPYCLYATFTSESGCIFNI